MIDRQVIINELYEKLNNEDLSKNIENIIFNFYENLNYSNKICEEMYYNKIFFILNNNNLLNKIKNYKKNNLDQFLFDYTKIYTKWNQINKELKLINSNSIIKNNINRNVEFYCSKCKKNTKCTYYLAQTRSADESMTCFITCLICGHNFKN